MPEKRPAWFRFDPNLWFADPKFGRLSFAARGALIGLIYAAWNDPEWQCSLPGDDDGLAEVIGASPEEWEEVSREVRRCLEPHPSMRDRVMIRRLHQEWVESLEIIEKKREAAEARWARHREEKNRRSGEDERPDGLQESMHVHSGCSAGAMTVHNITEHNRTIQDNGRALPARGREPEPGREGDDGDPPGDPPNVIDVSQEPFDPDGPRDPEQPPRWVAEDCPPGTWADACLAADVVEAVWPRWLSERADHEGWSEAHRASLGGNRRAHGLCLLWQGINKTRGPESASFSLLSLPWMIRRAFSSDELSDFGLKTEKLANRLVKLLRHGFEPSTDMQTIGALELERGLLGSAFSPGQREIDQIRGELAHIRRMRVAQG